MRQYPSYLVAAIIKQWWFLTILSVIALACISCSDAAQQASQSQKETIRSPHITKGGGMPLTDSAPSQWDTTPTALASTPTATSSTSYEAEAVDNTKDGTQTFSCNLCSGGLRVGWISYNIFLQFNHIIVNHGGNYTLTIYYLNSIPDRQTSAFVSVNGRPNVMVPGLQILHVNCCDNIPPQVAQMTVSLYAGNNTIKISTSPTGNAPDIDRIVVG